MLLQYLNSSDPSQRFHLQTLLAAVSSGMSCRMPERDDEHVGIWWYIGTVNQPHTMTEYERVTGASEGTPSSWIYYYSGLGEESIWDDHTSIAKQYLFSFYWAASTLSTSSLVGQATPKNQNEILFTVWCVASTGQILVQTEACADLLLLLCMLGCIHVIWFGRIS
jgi:hypothetical protein